LKQKTSNLGGGTNMTVATYKKPIRSTEIDLNDPVQLLSFLNYAVDQKAERQTVDRIRAKRRAHAPSKKRE